MKIRSGFVSNSSSSSYIVRSDIGDVATHMLNVVIKDYGEFDKATKTRNSKKYNEWKTNLKRKLKDINVQKGKHGISFPSVNYRTYVLQVGKNCHISTCNNQIWNLYENFDVLFEGYGEDNGDDDVAYASTNNKYFHQVENDLILSIEKCIYGDSEKDYSDLYCKKCKMKPFSYAESPEGVMHCGICKIKIGDESPESKKRKEYKLFEEKKKNAISKINPFSHIEVI